MLLLVGPSLDSELDRERGRGDGEELRLRLELRTGLGLELRTGLGLELRLRLRSSVDLYCAPPSWCCWRWYAILFGFTPGRGGGP